MSHLRNALLAGAAIFTLAGGASLAQAQTADPAVHVMTVQLPNGAVQQIRYTGDVPPRIVLVPVVQSVELPFAMMQRMSAAMDRQIATMMQAFAPMMAQPFATGPMEAGFGAMPAGAGAGVCMRSISVTYTGHGQPQVVSKSAGNCGPAANTPAATPETVAPAPSVRTIQVRDDHPVGQPAYRAMVVPATVFRG